MFLVNSGIPMKPINKNIPKVEINAIFFLLIFEFLFNLFPLDGGWRLARNIIGDPRNLGNFVNNAIRNFL